MTKEQAKDKRLKRLYGISLEERLRMEKSHGGKCWICGRAPVTKALAVDHDHKLRYVKVRTKRDASGWGAEAWIGNYGIFAFAPRRNDAIRAVRERLKAVSVRGLLCFQCNAGLRKFSDDPAHLESAARYLREYHSRFEWNYEPAS